MKTFLLTDDFKDWFIKTNRAQFDEFGKDVLKYKEQEKCIERARLLGLTAHADEMEDDMNFSIKQAGRYPVIIESCGVVKEFDY